MDVRLNRLFFRATSSGTLPRFSGGMARGMLFSALKNHDKHAAQMIHDQEGIKQYSLSGFRKIYTDTLSVMDRQMGQNRRKRRDKMIHPGDILYFDVATSSEKLQGSLPAAFQEKWEADKSAVDMDPLQIKEAEVQAILGKEIPNPIRIRFITPVSFTTGHTYSVWPEPKSMMQNLTSIWNVWFPEAQINASEILETHAQNIRIISAEGKVIGANAAKNMKHVGWTGEVHYSSEDEVSFGIFSNLLKLGFITGVGRGRTAGLGRFYIPRILHSDKLISIV